MKSTRLRFVWYAAPAVFAVVCAGALGGSSIGSTTSLKKPTKVLPDMSGNSAIGDYQPSDSRKLPNHYPLVTPSGTIPVAELARHGRLRNSRNEWRGPFDESGVDTKQEWELDNNEIDRLADWHPTNNRATEAFDRGYQSDRTKNAFSETQKPGRKRRPRSNLFAQKCRWPTPQLRARDLQALIMCAEAMPRLENLFPSRRAPRSRSKLVCVGARLVEQRRR